MIRLDFRHLFFELTIALLLFLNFVSSSGTGCDDSEGTGLYIYNTRYCRFYRCEFNKQVRLQCNRTADSLNGAGTTHIRSVLDKFYRYANDMISSGTNVKLFLELSGPPTTYPNVEQSFTDALIGPSKAFLHKLRISTVNDWHIDRNVFRSLPNLKMLDLELTASHSGAALSPRFFEGLTDLESLNIKLNGAPSPLNREIFYELPSLLCLNILGSNFDCNCDTQYFVRKSPFWRMKEKYQNPLVDDDVSSCGSFAGSTCGRPPKFAGKPIEKASFSDCPPVPQDPNVPAGRPPLYGSTVTCDFNNLEVKLINVGQTSGLDFTLGRNSDPDCKFTPKNGIVHLSASGGKCGTQIIYDSNLKKMLFRNTAFISFKSAAAAKVSSKTPALPVTMVQIPVSCNSSYTGKMSQEFKAPQMAETYAEIKWQGTATITLDVLPRTSILGPVTFDITLETAREGEWRFSAHNCWATPTADPNGQVRHSIIENGCKVDPSLTWEEQDSAEQYARQEFSIHPFYFPEIQAEYLHIHCDVLPCNATDVSDCSPKECAATETPTPTAPATNGETETTEEGSGNFVEITGRETDEVTTNEFMPLHINSGENKSVLPLTDSLNSGIHHSFIGRVRSGILNPWRANSFVWRRMGMNMPSQWNRIPASFDST